MNQELANLIKKYTTEKHEEVNRYLIGKSKDTLIAVLLDLLTMYINDKNSSTIREFVTVAFAGYIHKEAKIGYNGYKQDSILSGKTLKCEAKPKNFDTEAIEKFKRGERKTSPAKLNAGGNFTDYTFERLERDKKENLNMLVSGFVDGKLIYILEFPFRHPNFIRRLEEQLLKRFPGGKDIPAEYLRGANFNYTHFADSTNLKIIHLLSKNELKEYEPYIAESFYKFLEGNAK